MRRVIVVTAVAVAAAGLWLVVDRGRQPGSLAQARALAANASGFDTGAESGETLARVAQHLEAAVVECRRENRGVRCQALASAFGYAQVLAAHVLVCTAPGRFESRTRMVAYLDRVAAVPATARRVPSPPRLPSCVD